MSEEGTSVLFVTRSVPKTVLIALGSLGFALMAAAIAFHWIQVPAGSFIELVGWAGMIFGGWLTVSGARLIFDSRPTIEIGPHGILDRRISEKMLRWQDVKAIRMAQIRSTKFITFDLVPGVRERLGGNLVRRYLDLLSLPMGYGAFSLSTGGLDTSFDQVEHAIMAAWSKAREFEE